MILVCGEALIDLFVHEDESANLTAEAVLGGSPFNVAIGLARLNTPSAFCGGLSFDSFGQALKQRLLRENVDVSFSIDSSCLTTLSVVATSPSGQPDYTFHGEGKADRQITPDMLTKPLPSAITALTFGSYTLAVTPVADAYLALARREAPSRVISLDPNLRPGVTPDITAWQQHFNAFASLADIVKASEEDIEIAYGEAAGVENVAKDWLATGASLVLVTHGGRGATGFLKNGDVVVVEGRTIEVRDTVGAGDTFHAAILASLFQAQRLTKKALAALTAHELRPAMDYAVAASAITCSRRGADLPTHAEVLALMRQGLLEVT